MNTIVYESNKYLKENIFRFIVRLCKEFTSSIELGLRLFARDFSAKYRQSLLGITWVVFMPIFTVAVFVVMNNSGVLQVGDTGVPYVVYALYGLTVWTLFSSLTTSVAATISSSGGLLSKINFPRIALIFSPVLVTFIDFLIRLLLLVIVTLVMIDNLNVFNFFLGILALIPIVFLGIALGLFFTVVGSVFKDFPTMLGIVFNFLMFVSPVIYPVSNKQGLIGIVAKLNPLTILLDVPRNIFFYGDFSNLSVLLLYALLAFILLILGLRFYNIALARIIERI